MKKLFLMMFLPLAMSHVSCDKSEDPIGGGGKTPDVSVTYSAEVKSYHSVVLKGYAYGADGKVGFCYSAIDKNPNPASCPYVETSSVKADNSYELTVNDLQPNTKYYYRAFATKGSKKVLANEVKTFTSKEFEVGAVDLGLSVKWANCNVGANAPEEFGDYYAWGETEPYYTESHSQDNPCEDWKDGKNGYNWATYEWSNGSLYDITKYNTLDKKTILDAADDAATANWGGSWRMPTKAEQEELRNNCTWTWTTINGVNGSKVVGPNGNYIFLPAAGQRVEKSLENVGSYGYFWSSTVHPNVSGASDYLFIMSVDPDFGYLGRACGRSIRPVCE